MSSLLLCLLICLSMHACKGRCLGLGKKPREQVFVKVLDIDKMNLHSTSISSEIMPLVLEKLGVQGHQEVDNDNKGTHDSLLGASIMKQKGLESFLKEKEDSSITTSGVVPPANKVIISSLNDLQQGAQVEGLKRQERSMLGSAPDDEEAIESKEVEQVVVMDYAQPHRKPPIHNEKP